MKIISDFLKNNRKKISKLIFLKFIFIQKLILIFINNRIVFWISGVVRRTYWKARLASLGDNSAILKGSIVMQPECVAVGRETVIGSFVHVWGGGGVEIGDRVLIASHCAITSMTHSLESLNYSKTSVSARVCIKDGVWIGAGSVILPGVTLGEGSVIGAGAVVTKDTEPYSLYTGVPARRVRCLR